MAAPELNLRTLITPGLTIELQDLSFLSITAPDEINLLELFDLEVATGSTDLQNAIDSGDVELSNQDGQIITNLRDAITGQRDDPDLAQDTWVVVFSRNGTNINNQYLRTSEGIRSDQSPPITLKDCYLIKITAINSATTASYDLLLEISTTYASGLSVFVPILTFSCSGRASSFEIDNLPLPVDTAFRIRVQNSSGNGRPDRPIVTLSFVERVISV